VWVWMTGTYYAAVIENQADFQGRVVVDVGAGSGILSLFAAQASTLPKQCCVLITQCLSH
jgi:histone-arginine methyltransferase CARM1